MPYYHIFNLIIVGKMLIFGKMCVNLHPNLNSSRLMRQLKTLFILLAGLSLTASCLSGGEEATLYSDAAITSFSLGTLNRYTASVTTEGKDTIVKSTVTGSSYTFHIDQVNHRIYNTDSLPYGTDVQHVLVTLTTYHNGIALIQSIEREDSLWYYSSTDSIDFSQPRKFLVWSSDGEGHTEYTVNVNVHKEQQDVFYWKQMEATDYPVHPLDAQNWGPNIKKFLGRSSVELYALSVDNKLMVSRDQGATWEEDLLDEDASMLPTQDLSLVSYYMDDVAENTDYVLLVGNRSTEDYPQESIAMVWRKIVDNGEYAPKGRWTYMGQLRDSRYALPRMENLCITEYADCVLAIGGKGLGGCTLTPYKYIYESRDNGITWKQSSRFVFPALDEFSTENPQIEMTDDDIYLWLNCVNTHQVWRGLLNTLLWRYQ